MSIPNPDRWTRPGGSLPAMALTGFVVALVSAFSWLGAPSLLEAQSGGFFPTPVRQYQAASPAGAVAEVTGVAGAAAPSLLTLRDVASPDRWLGQEVRGVRWALDGSGVYFRWHRDPQPDEDPDLDPWYRVDREGATVSELPDSLVHLVPASSPEWSADGRRAVWASGGDLYFWEAGPAVGSAPPAAPGGGAGAGPAADLARTRVIHSGATPVRFPEFTPDDGSILFMLGEDLYRHQLAEGRTVRLTRRHTLERDTRGEMARWLEAQQRELIRHHDQARARDDARRERSRVVDGTPTQAIPVARGVRIDRIRLSPDGSWLAVRWTRPARREATVYADYAHESGYTRAPTARPKVGEPRDEVGMGIVRIDPRLHPDSVEMVQVSLAEAEGRPTVIHGPWWSPDGDRAAVQLLSRDHKDLWIGLLDPATGDVRVIDHQHDPAWIGGPPIQGGSLQPTLLEWFPDGRLAFASERSGWSHLYLWGDGAGTRALTGGAWEVRGAELSRDRSTWLLQASREHPADDHLYLLPAAGGDLARITERQGRSVGRLSPDGSRVAVTWGETVQLPDLFLQQARPGGDEVRVTVSGSQRFAAHRWRRPEIVAFPHPDGDPVWAALYLPDQPNQERAAVLHIHGGGYRQFAHRGWSVYGFANHVGFIHWLVEQGYTVLDFDYRGSSGFGRDYRTDIYRSMGMSDVDGAVAAVDWLAGEHGIDPGRVGMYGVSYGGFFTLMSLFRYPGVFAAGVSNDGVTDWAHYSDGWTSRILNLPFEDEEAYRTSSPIYHAEGLEDALLIVHGVIDDNVHFQDAVRLVQRLIELEKEFDVMFYPLERHNFAHPAGRYDYYRRVADLFERVLLGADG